MTAEPLALLPRLEALLGAEWVSAERTDRWEVDGVTPRVAVRPADAEQAGAVLRLCGEAGAAVVPWGGGTAVEVGNPPRAAGVVLLTERLSRVVEHDHSNLTVTVEAGITLGALEAALRTHGQFLPLEPPRAEAATAGGAVAVNLAGPRRMAHGAARDLVIGMRIVQADGTAIRAGGKTVKNVAGYDLCKLFVGSMGTLGLLTELTFKVSPLPETSRTVAVWGPRLADLSALAGRVLASPLLPAAATVVNAPAAGTLGRAACGLLVRAAGFEAAVTRHEREIAGWSAQAGLQVEVLEGDGEAALWRAIRDFGWHADGTAVRVSVPAGKVAGLLDRLHETLPLAAGILAHLPSGAIWIGMDAGELTPAMLAALRDLAVAHSGHSLLARAPQALKAGTDVWAPPPEPRALEVMRGLKQAFDPRGILNPGRFVAGL